VIPCFAVERSQELLLDIDALLRSGSIPRAAVFLDSPLAGRITEAFRRNAAAMPGMPRDGRDPFANPAFRITEGVDDSMAINRIRGGAIIISASGMAEAGRVKHHLRNNLWRPEATVLFVGYQAPGTLGALLLGRAERVRIHDRDVEVRATIRSIGSYSAHADQRELIAWALERRPVAGTVFLTHGEEPARAALRDLLAARGFDREAITLPQLDDAYDLAGASAVLAEPGGRRAAPEALASDWVDAQFAFDRALHRALDAAPDDAARARLIARLDRTLAGG
jgi:metallo-beta-lactamase family protein